MSVEATQEAKDMKSAKKFMWILMLIPIGLGVGVVTSNINFRKAEEAKADTSLYRASQIFNKAGLEDDMTKILLSQGEGADYFLRHISSTLGINNYLTVDPIQGSGSNRGFYDVEGEDAKSVTAIVIELDESNPVAKSSLLAIPAAVIKSLAGEKDFTHTLRFIFLPKKYDGNEFLLKEKGERLKSHIIIRAGGDFSLNDDIKWREENLVWRHPAMAHPHESVDDYITEGQVELSMQAALDLKKSIELMMVK